MIQSEETRRRLKFLRHVPLAAEFQLVEVDLSKMLPQEALAPFIEEISQRQKRRQKREKALAREAARDARQKAAEAQSRQVSNSLQNILCSCICIVMLLDGALWIDAICRAHPWKSGAYSPSHHQIHLLISTGGIRSRESWRWMTQQEKLQQPPAPTPGSRLQLSPAWGLLRQLILRHWAANLKRGVPQACRAPGACDRQEARLCRLQAHRHPEQLQVFGPGITWALMLHHYARLQAPVSRCL